MWGFLWRKGSMTFLKMLKIVGAHSTSGKATRMWRGTLSEALPPGKDLKPRVIILTASFNFFDPSPWPAISVQNPPMLWCDNDLDGNIWRGWPLGMDLITSWAFEKWYKKHLVDQALPWMLCFLAVLLDWKFTVSQQTPPSPAIPELHQSVCPQACSEVSSLTASVL